MLKEVFKKLGINKEIELMEIEFETKDINKLTQEEKVMFIMYLWITDVFDLHIEWIDLDIDLDKKTVKMVWLNNLDSNK